MDSQADGKPTPLPKDAREATDEQREEEELLEHQGDDPEAPGAHQSRHDVPDESTR